MPSAYSTGRILLDTSVYSQPIKKQPLQSVIRRWRERPEFRCCISVICYLEVLYGIYRSGSPTLRTAWEKLLKDRFDMLPFDEVCAARYARLQADAVAAGRTHPVFDLMIAATALVHDTALATCNARDFEGIPGLVVEDWSE